MKKVLFTLTCSFFMLCNSSAVVAQETKEQQVPYREIIKRYATLMGELRRSVLTPEEKKQKHIILLSQREAEIKSMLTPEQFEIYQKLEADRQAKQVNMRKQPVKMQ
jgi:hypothetical protein